MIPGVYCACGCHYEQPEGRVHVNDELGSVVACHRCKANHKPPRFIPEPPWRRTNFDPPTQFEPPHPADAVGNSEDDSPPLNGEDGG